MVVSTALGGIPRIGYSRELVTSCGRVRAADRGWSSLAVHRGRSPVLDRQDRRVDAGVNLQLGERVLEMSVDGMAGESGAGRSACSRALRLPEGRPRLERTSIPRQRSRGARWRCRNGAWKPSRPTKSIKAATEQPRGSVGKIMAWSSRPGWDAAGSFTRAPRVQICHRGCCGRGCCGMDPTGATAQFRLPVVGQRGAARRDLQARRPQQHRGNSTRFPQADSAGDAGGRDSDGPDPL
jgi:hypothetical protein